MPRPRLISAQSSTLSLVSGNTIRITGSNDNLRSTLGPNGQPNPGEALAPKEARTSAACANQRKGLPSRRCSSRRPEAPALRRIDGRGSRARTRQPRHPNGIWGWRTPLRRRAAKISKTTPCKGAGGRHGWVESRLTRRANQGHFPTIPQSCKRLSRRNHAARRLRLRHNILTHIEIGPPNRGIARA